MSAKEKQKSGWPKTLRLSEACIKKRIGVYCMRHQKYWLPEDPVHTINEPSRQTMAGMQKGWLIEVKGAPPPAKPEAEPPKPEDRAPAVEPELAKAEPSTTTEPPVPQDHGVEQMVNPTKLARVRKGNVREDGVYDLVKETDDAFVVALPDQDEPTRLMKKSGWQRAE